jgi:hypothetical protein
MDMEVWTYRESMPASTDIFTGFAVEATDGSIGHVDAASNEYALVTSWSTPALGSLDAES